VLITGWAVAQVCYRKTGIFDLPWRRNPESTARRRQLHLIFQIWERSVYAGGLGDVPRFTGHSSSWTEQRHTRRSFQGGCHSEIDVCMPRLVGIHHGPRSAENGSCHPPWSAFRLLLHQPGSSSRSRRSSWRNSVRVFENILHNKQHVLHQQLPDRTQPTYNLRSRKHDCWLTVKHLITVNAFITRMLYEYIY